MGLSQFLRFLLISTVLALCFSQGLCGRKLMGFEKEDSTGLLKDLAKDTEGGSRMLIQVMDYSDPGANSRNARFTPPSRRL
ncbi:hypothetical protein ACHQM5_006316 [Ranunculus cassubicifolius]